MRALTIYQPWASLVIAGAKPFEFRGWSPRERGPAYAGLIGQRIVIHASSRAIDRPLILRLIQSLEAGGDEAAMTCLHKDLAMPVLEKAMMASSTDERGRCVDMRKHGDLPWGVGLGTAVLGEPRDGIDIAVRDFGLSPPDPEPIGFNPHSGAENPFGDETEGLGGFDSDRQQHSNFGWPMLDIEAWDMPVEARGGQGFWTWPTPSSAAL